MKVKEDAAVFEGLFAVGGEVTGEGVTEGWLGDVTERGVAAVKELVKHGVGGGNPLEDEVMGGEVGGEGGDAFKGDVTCDEQVMEDGEHEDGVKVSGCAAQEGGGLAVAPSGGGRGIGEVDVEGKNVERLGGWVGAELGVELVDGVEVGVDGDDGGAGAGGEAGVDAGVAADVEDALRGGVGKCGSDKVSFAVVLAGRVVGGGGGVVGPLRGAVGGGDFADLVAEVAEGFEEDVADELGVAFGHWAGGDRFVFRKEGGEGDGGACGLAKTFFPGEGGIDLLGLVSVAAGKRGFEGPGELCMGEEREEEGANKLGVGVPDGLGEIGGGDGEDVDEDGAVAAEEDVEGGGVFEDVAFGEETGAELEGEFGGAEPHGRGPLPRVGGEGDAGVLEGEGAVRCVTRVGREDLAGDELAFGDERFGEGGGEEGEDLGVVGRVDAAAGGVAG